MDNIVPVGDRTYESVNVRHLNSATLATNGILSLLNLTSYLLDRQIATQASKFETEDGFTERLYRVRKAKRQNR